MAIVALGTLLPTGLNPPSLSRRVVGLGAGAAALTSLSRAASAESWQPAVKIDDVANLKMPSIGFKRIGDDAPAAPQKPMNGPGPEAAANRLLLKLRNGPAEAFGVEPKETESFTTYVRPMSGPQNLGAAMAYVETPIDVDFIWLVDAASGNIVAAKECKDRSRASKLMAPIARGLTVVPYAACDGRSCETAVYKGDTPFKITTENVEIPLTLPMRFDK